MVDAALEGRVIPDEVYLPPVVLSRREIVTSWEGFDKYKPPTISQQRIRINVECDPVGQLMAIANGLPIGSFVVVPGKKPGDDPTVEIRYETAGLGTRIKLLQAMQAKVVSDLARNSDKKDKQESTDDDKEWADLTRGRSDAILAGKSNPGS